VTPTDEEDFAPLPGADELILPRAPDDDRAASDDEAAGSAEARSLFEDVEALIEDGKTYLEAELNFQKTRTRFAADQAKWALVFGLAALILVFLALVGLTVGLIIALTPLLTAWGATALVVILLGIVAAIAARAALRRGKELAGAFGSSTETKP
jgi:uncharacterized membrane protein YqjE